MPAHRKAITGIGNARVHGVVPGSTEHKIILALRAPGGLSPDQISARFGHVSGALWRLKRAGLVDMPDDPGKGRAVALTDRARNLTAHDGPLNRRTTLITYCQL